MNTMLPPPAAAIAEPPCLHRLKACRRHMSKLQSQSSVGMSARWAQRAIPTTSTIPVTDPNSRLASSRMRRTSSSTRRVGDAGDALDFRGNVGGPVPVDVDAEDPGTLLSEGVRRLPSHSLSRPDHDDATAVDAAESRGIPARQNCRYEPSSDLRLDGADPCGLVDASRCVNTRSSSTPTYRNASRGFGAKQAAEQM